MVAAPPRTPAGIVAMSAPNFGDSDSTSAVAAATQYAAVEYTRVAAMTPMFSAYVVVPDPPPTPASVVARPSAKSARPVRSSRFLPVIAATDFTWPTFSAISTSTTGTNRPSTATSNVGVTNSGKPIHAASRSASNDTSPRTTATTYPTSTPTRIDRRPRMPLNRTLTRMIAVSVTTAVTGACWKL